MFSPRSKFFLPLLSTAALVCSLIPSQISAQDDGAPAIPAEGFRTEADERADEQQEAMTLRFSSIGTIPVDVDIKQAGTYTIGLYRPGAELVRILAQAMDLPKGIVPLRWDGLDLWGREVPPGTDLELRIIRSPGVKAIYEFAVHPNEQPWGGFFKGTPGTSSERFGGWLSDHAPPNAAVGIGNYIAVSSKMAEHGNNVMLLDEKSGALVWGIQMAGWDGAYLLRTDGDDLYAIQRNQRTIRKSDLFTLDSRNKKVIGTWKDIKGQKLLTMAVGPEEVITLGESHTVRINPFKSAMGKKAIDFANATPQVLNSTPPTPFTVSPQSAFGSTFTGSAQPQTGAKMHVHENAGYVVLPFKQDVTFSTIQFSKLDGASDIEVFALAPGLAFDPLKHEPTPAEGDELTALLGSEPLLDDNWVRVGAVKPDKLVNTLSPKGGPVTTGAVYIKANQGDVKKSKKKWSPTLRSAIFYKNQWQDITPANFSITHTHDGNDVEPKKVNTSGWQVRTEKAITGDAPLLSVVEFDKPQTIDAIGLIDPLVNEVLVEALPESYKGDPKTAPDSVWEQVARFKGRNHRKLGTSTVSRTHFNFIVPFEDRTTTSALRLKSTTGYVAGQAKWKRFNKYGKLPKKEDPMFAEIGGLHLITMSAGGEEKPDPYVLIRHDKESKEELARATLKERPFLQMAYGDDGILYAVAADGKVGAVDFSKEPFDFKPLKDAKVAGATDITARSGTIAVAARSDNKVYLFKTDGTPKGHIGTGEPRQIGKWDTQVIQSPRSAGISSTGDIWIAENTYQPKRISRFKPSGEFIAEFLGPPHYGGGGHLDPNLKWFYYRGLQFALDFTAGTHRLAASNDRSYKEETIGLENGTFSFTALDQPYRINGRVYVAGYTGGGFAIVMQDNDSFKWRPVFISGPAQKSPFLLNKSLWKDEFAAANLVGKTFYWSDLNEDGKFQREELTLYTPEDAPEGFANIPKGGNVGPGLKLWSKGAHITPREITPGGVPRYHLEDWKPWKYPVPVYPRNFTLGSSSGAKGQYSGFMAFLPDGSMIVEGQPYVIQPDGTIIGDIPEKPTDYIPEIDGHVLNQPWSFAGVVGKGNDEVGELAILNSNNGYWYVWAARQGVIVDTFFDGTKGKFGQSKETHMATPIAKRGADMTGYKQGWEAWGASAVRADDGNVYVVAGHSFHGIFRIDGVDEISLEKQPFRVPDTSGKTATLRSWLKGSTHARNHARGNRPLLEMEESSKRAPGLRVDGTISEWGTTDRFKPVSDLKTGIAFDMTIDKEGLVIACVGDAPLGNAASNWEELGQKGFAFEISVRESTRNRDRLPTEGDRRFIIGKLDGKWTMVEYIFSGDSSGSESDLSSPFGSLGLSAANVVDPSRYEFAMNELSLEEQLGSTPAGDILDPDITMQDGLPTLETAGKKKNKKKKTTAKTERAMPWSCEILLPWELLGRQQGARSPRLFDFAVNVPNKNIDGVAERISWSRPPSQPTGDKVLDLTINPTAWGQVLKLNN